MPNVRPVPATATNDRVDDQPWSPTTADSDATVPTTPSPSAMIVNSPYRSAMWWACHGVPPCVLGDHRPESSRRPTSSATTIAMVTGTDGAAKIAAIQPIWAIVIHRA